ncbi:MULTISPECIES: winged helix-turn-helix domain-containing protein [unclassified Pseudoalteromonas]|uniref:winged helix-turn-helix domain-containing protein n=1 Tax=unclassified Pseudoalteromonas TaxID=194690 RepID=UPI0006942E91|nr:MULTISPECIES: winged helix-turn-helix domain-containing protein [unclassified Pseudoalteromonas]
MRYYFEKYCFDQDTLTLYFNEQPKAIKNNEAKLLALFIKNKNTILSKEIILTEIWGEQSVSEQVVFQTISQLRSVFGSHAIKTFPKKGYQLQLPFERQQSPQSEIDLPPAKINNNPLNYPFLITSALIIIFAMAIFLYFSEEKKPNNKLHLIPFSLAGDAEQKQLDNLNNLISKYGNEHLSSTSTLSLFNYPDMTKKTLKLESNSVVLSGYLSPYYKNLLIEYKLVGSKRSWSGYLIAQDEKSLATSLKKTIDGIQESGYLNEANPALLSSKLRLLLDKQPNNHSVIYHLLKQQLNNQDYDVAKALVEQLINLEPESPYIALGSLVKAGIFHQQQEFDQALKHYNLSLTQLADEKFPEIRYKVASSKAWLYYALKKSAKVEQHILNAAKYAQQKNDVLAHISAYTTGSILFHKLDDMVNRYKYLNTAKSLLITHQVSDAHFAIIYYHLGLFASDKKEAESYYLKILSLPKLAKYQWLYESAIEDLLSWYIENKQWDKAISLFHSQPENSFNLSQKARLFKAEGKFNDAFNIAKSAFDKARLNYQHNHALHAALLLYQFQTHINQPHTPDYQNYIKHNASNFWLDKHKHELIKLGYFDNLTH